MAGYSGTPLIKKLGIKDGHRLRIVAAPTGWPGVLELGPNVRVVAEGEFDVGIVFAADRARLEQSFPDLLAKLPADGMIWLAWPKKASGVASDLSFSSVQRLGLDAGIVDVKNCAIDETWSGLKFVVRKAERSQWRGGAG